MKLKILAIVVLGAVGVGAAFVALGGMPSNAAATSKFLTSTATTGNISDDVAASGSVATTVSYGLAFGAPAHLAGDDAAAGSTAWTVTDVKVAVGDAVKTGDVLASADTADLHRQLVDANAALSSARIQLRIAKENLKDAEDAEDLDGRRQARMSKYDAETRVSDAEQARADVLDQIRLATLTAPIDGIVSAVDIVTGLDAPSGDAIVIDGTTYQVTADVVESDVAKIAVGQKATVSIDALGADISGTVTALAPTASDASSGVVSYAATVVLTDPPEAVRAGMTADVTITVANAAGVLTVPAAALRGDDGDYSVLVLDATGQPVAKPVQVGLVTASLAEVKSGLTEGEPVVIGVNTAQNQTTVTNGNGFNRDFGGGVAVPGGKGPQIKVGP